MLQVALDDAGVDPAIDAAVLDLAGDGLVKSVSLVVNYPGSAQTGARLSKLPVDIGLHFNMSSGVALSPVPCSLTRDDCSFWNPREGLAPNTMFSAAIETYLSEHCERRSLQEDIITELRMQFDAFVRMVGEAPKFLSVHHDLDRSTRVKEAVGKCLPALPGREYRLETKALASYTCLFAAAEETVDLYRSRAMTRLQDSHHSDSAHLVVFHPSAEMPSPDFTVYLSGRLVEFAFLRELSTRELLLASHSEMGNSEGASTAVGNLQR